MSALSTYVVTFNCGRVSISPTAFASHLFSGLSKPSLPPDVLVLCLQEVAPIAYAFLGGSYLNAYLQKFEQAIDLASKSMHGANYQKIATNHVGMTGILVFVNEKPAANVRSLYRAEVGVGLWEMGNKGAAGVQVEYDLGHGSSASMTFLSAHLAPMEWAVPRRNEDWANIVRRAVFEVKSSGSSPTSGSHSINAPLLTPNDDSRSTSSESNSGIYDSDYTIIGGDLNYRTNSVGPYPEDPARFPQPCEDDSHPQHFEHLLMSDQLKREMKAGRAFQGMQEGSIDFPPTYKYSNKARKNLQAGTTPAEAMDDAQDGHWEWASHRWPSWCDRVLYMKAPASSTKPNVQVVRYTSLPLMASSDHRPVACELRLLTDDIPRSRDLTRQEEASRSQSPYSIDPGWKGRRRAARGREIVVGLLALLSTTWEAIWIWTGLILILFVFGTGVQWWDV